MLVWHNAFQLIISFHLYLQYHDCTSQKQVYGTITVILKETIQGKFVDQLQSTINEDYFLFFTVTALSENRIFRPTPLGLIM